jgi:hypothetical protein
LFRLPQSASQARIELARPTILEIHRAEYAAIQIDVLLGQECRCGRPWIWLFRVSDTSGTVVDFAAPLIRVLAVIIALWPHLVNVVQDAAFVLDESKLRHAIWLPRSSSFPAINRISIGLSPKLQLLNNAIGSVMVCAFAVEQIARPISNANSLCIFFPF